MTDFIASTSDAGSLLDGEPIAEAAPAARRTRQARVAWGDNVVTVGGDAPVRVQSMTNTDTVQVIETAIQVKELALAGHVHLFEALSFASGQPASRLTSWRNGSESSSL